MSIRELYAQPPALLTDLYQLTMAYAYWKSGIAERRAAFNLFFRSNPFRGGFAIAAGLKSAVEGLETFRFSDDDIAYLRTLTGNDGGPLFEPEFLQRLQRMEWECDLDAIPEGTVVFPHEPLVRVQGPIIQCQLLETFLLNTINFQTLVATKAARICLAASGDEVIEFGLRRAQGIDGGVSASRAAYIGGCTATSNMKAGQLLGIPVRGTHAHSWVMSYGDEREAFAAYADAMPNNVVLLVDTYDTIDGIKHAIETGTVLRERGHRLAGIRLDSGDLAWLSIEARRMLDQAGFHDAFIVASNDLDEHLIADLKQQQAKINVWGVGTKLVTAQDQPALGGVYKLSAVQDDQGRWQPRIKLSEQSVKISNPGILQVRRMHRESEICADMIFDRRLGVPDAATMVDPLDPTRRRRVHGPCEDLLVPIFRRGKLVQTLPDIEQLRARTQQQLATCHTGLLRFVNPHQYPVGLESQLHELKTALILEARAARSDSTDY